MKKLKIDLSGADCRVLLQQELLERTKANPSYSLRAFARSLNLEPSRLSKILTGKRPVSPQLLEGIGQRLGMSLTQIETLKTNLPKRWSKRGDDKSTTSASRHYQQLPLDTFEIISDWRHYAILELMKIKGFKNDPKWIGEKIGISTRNVKNFIDRLVRVGLLEISKEGQWKDLSDGFSTHVLVENYTSYAHKKAQADILQLAMQALQDVSIERRDQSSTMISTNTKKLQDAKKMIKEFRLKLADFLEDTDEKNAIFQLSVSLFPLVDSKDQK